MAWTQPKTWSSEPLTSSDLNTHLRDNLEALKDPPSAAYILDESSDYVTTSATFVDVDATEGKFQHTIVTNGGDVMVHFHSLMSDANALFDVAVDGVRHAGDDGIARPGAGAVMSFVRLISGLAPGSHTFKLQWRVFSTGTPKLPATTLHGQFWVREVS